ncbi:MAG: glycosyltransferase family 2 protein [Ilumatobacteraceae bacterium]
MSAAPTFEWVVLTLGDRPGELERAVRSLVKNEGVEVLVVANGASAEAVPELPSVRSIVLDDNVGVPAGRHAGLQATRSAVVGFLDDDATLEGDLSSVIRAFDDDGSLGAVSLRIVDEDGATSPRHVPRVGGANPGAAGSVTHFLGGACAIRREAYDEAGGYFADLFYGHEEIELSWRLLDAGWRIDYLTDVVVRHPRTEISRHEKGWRLTGRNRVWIARRTLPWPVAIVHVAVWLVGGFVRAPRACRRAYLAGWWSGWTTSWPSGVRRRPIRWSTVWRLTRLGRPPIV